MFAAAVGAKGTPVSVGDARFALRLRAVVANAVVASCVVFVPALAVGAVGVPVSGGDASGAFSASAVSICPFEAACVAVVASGTTGDEVKVLTPPTLCAVVKSTPPLVSTKSLVAACKLAVGAPESVSRPVIVPPALGRAALAVVVALFAVVCAAAAAVEATAAAADATESIAVQIVPSNPYPA